MEAKFGLFTASEDFDLQWVEAVDAKRLDDSLLRSEACGEMLCWLGLLSAVLELAREKEFLLEPKGALKALPQPFRVDEIDPDQWCLDVTHGAASPPASRLSEKPTAP